MHLNPKYFCPLNIGHLFAELKCLTNAKYGQVQGNIRQSDKVKEPSICE